MIPEQQTTFPIASLFRRIAALFYDFLLLCAIWTFTTLLILFILFDGKAPENAWQLQLSVLPLNILVTYLFYAWCWTHGGQTLGMQAWRIRTVTSEGKPLSSKDCILRCTFGFISLACFGLGYGYAILNSNRLSLHDLLSKTRVILLPPVKK